MSITKLFFNWFYRFKPPEVVQYWKHKNAARARLGHNDDGSIHMEIEGEKYLYPGFPRGYILTGPLAKIKHKMKNMVFNQAFAEMEKMVSENKYDILPDDRCAPAVREMARVFDVLIEMEVVDDMKKRMQLIKKVLIFFLQEDDAYRFRAQKFLELIDQEKIKLSKADKYYARAKYWKTDYDKFDY